MTERTGAGGRGRRRWPDVLGREPAWSELAAALAEGFAQTFGVQLRREGLADAEREHAAAGSERYGDAAWTWHQ